MPPRSMTGFGRARAEGPLGRFTAEIKSVNNRHKEFAVHVPRDLTAFEPRVRALLRDEVERGKIECRVTFDPVTGRAKNFHLNEAVILRYAGELAELARRNGLAGEVTLPALLALPGVIDSDGEETELEDHWPPVEQTVREAMAAFQADRAREGEAMARHLGEELKLLRERREAVALVKDLVVRRQRERLTARIAELEAETRGKADPNRLEMEIAMYADRCDVSEELVRLGAHLDQFEILITGNGGKPAGRPLDFLVQEIFREVNTIGSKAHDIGQTQAALDMKAAIERAREQIQNIE